MSAFGKSGSGSANTSGSGSGQGNLTGSGNGNGNGSGSGSNGGNSWGLAGRSLVGNLPKPTYNSQETGTVVVEITVDKTGAVVAAKVISKGTTVQSSYLWAQAESAAKKAKFNADAKANALQKGTITYHFTLK
ncbi:MAG: energy transducer TonB [Bacteroidales bacterium]|nr:energy transducer TonB [Bacteroidales bacterium]